MQRIVGKSSLRTLVLSGSTVAPLAARRLADGVAMSKTLKELHLDGCQLACADVLSFVVAIERCAAFGQFKELNVGTLLGKGHEQRDLFGNILMAGVSDKITLVYNDCLVAPLWEALKTNITLVNVSLSYGETTEIDPLLYVLRNTVGTLKNLCIDTPQVLGSVGGQFLAHIIRKGESLKVVRLRCRTEASASIHILKALADSRSVALLTIERWDLSESVGCAFTDMLRQNRSLNRLEFYWSDADSYVFFKRQVQRGLKVNASVSVVKMYQGQQRDEVAVCHMATLQSLHKNAMILAWVTDVILREGMCLEAAAAADFFKVCDAPLDMFQRTADFSPRTATNRIRLVRMATRTQYYALLSAFGDGFEYNLTPLGRALFQNMLYSMRDDVLSAMGLQTDLYG
nr:NLR family CARD domain-containing protein 3-like [Dermacentor andersoni]